MPTGLRAPSDSWIKGSNWTSKSVHNSANINNMHVQCLNDFNMCGENSMLCGEGVGVGGYVPSTYWRLRESGNTVATTGGVWCVFSASLSAKASKPRQKWRGQGFSSQLWLQQEVCLGRGRAVCAKSFLEQPSVPTHANTKPGVRAVTSSIDCVKIHRTHKAPLVTSGRKKGHTMEMGGKNNHFSCVWRISLI